MKSIKKETDTKIFSVGEMSINGDVEYKVIKCSQKDMDIFIESVSKNKTTIGLVVQEINELYQEIKDGYSFSKKFSEKLVPNSENCTDGDTDGKDI